MSKLSWNDKIKFFNLGHGVHVEFHPNACVFAVALSNGNVKLYDTRTRKLQQHYQIHDDTLSQIAFHKTGNYLLTASLDSTMKVNQSLNNYLNGSCRILIGIVCS